MAQNIDEIYNELIQDERFKSLYPTQTDFVQFLENEPTADADIEQLFGVKSASEYLKKKDQPIIQNLGNESSSFQSLSVGQTEPVPQQTQGMVEQPQEGGNQNLGDIADPYGLQAMGLPPLGYGKSLAGGPQPPKKVNPQVANYIGALDGLIKEARTKNDLSAVQNVLQRISSFQLDPQYSQFVKQGQFKNQYEQLNAIIAEVYSNKPMAFSDKKFQEGITKLGFQNPVGAKPEVLFRAKQENNPTFFPKQKGAPFIQKTLDQQIKELETPKPLDEKSQVAVEYLSSYDEQFNPLEYDVQFMLGRNQNAGYEMSSEIKADYLTSQEQKFDKTFQADVNNLLKGAVYNLPANFFDSDAIISQTKELVDAKTGAVRTVTENVTNPNRKLTTDKGIYMVDDAGNPKVNPIYLEEFVDRQLRMPGGIASQQVVDAFNLKRKGAGLDEYTKEEVIEIIKPRVLRMATITAEQQLENNIVEQRLRKIDIYEDEVEKVNRDMDFEVKSLVGNSQKLINNFKIEVVENTKAEVEKLNESVKKSNEDLFAQYKIAAQNASSPEMQNAIYQNYVQQVNLNATRYEEQVAALRKNTEAKFTNYALQVENDAKKELEVIKGKYGVISDKDEQGKLTTAAYRKYRDAFKKEYNAYKTEERANSDAMGWRLTDILQSGSARVFGNAIQALNAAVGYEDNPLTDLMKYLDFVQTKSDVAIKPFSQVLDEDGLFSVQALKTAVQSTVQQGPNLALGIATTALSGNPYIGGSLMWGYETIDQVGQNYRDVFKRTGSILQAEDAAAQTLQTQIMIAPVYTLSMLPFTKGFLSKMASGGNALGFTKKFGLGLALEASEEIPVEIAQNYLTYKFANDNPEKFATWLSKNGGNTALDVLPSIAVLGGGSAGMETYSERMTEQAKSRVLATLGRLGMTQTIADAAQVIGEGGVNILPEYLYRTQQIDAQELKDMKRAFGEVVKALPQAQELIRDQDTQKYYITLASEKARRQRQMEEAQDEDQKKELGEIVKSIEKKMADVVTGKPQQLTKITFKDGGSVVLANDEMVSFLINKNFLENVADGSIQVTTQDANINRIVEEKKKEVETRLQEATDPGAKRLNAAETKAKERGATIKDGEKLLSVAQKAAQNGQKNTDTILDQAAVLQSALDQVAPGVNIVFLNNDEYVQTMDEVSGKASSSGNFTFKKNDDGTYSVEIQVNLDKATTTTVGHEVAHALLLRTLGSDPKLFDKMRAQLNNVIKGTIDNRSLLEIESLVNRYSKIEQSEEFLVELASILALNGKNLEINTIEKIAKVISDFIAYVTGGKVQLFDKISSRADFVKFMNGMAETLRTGELTAPIQEKIATETQEGAQLTEEGQKEVKSKARVDEVGLTTKEVSEDVISVTDYNERARELAQAVKRGDIDAINAMAEEMAVKVPSNAVLVPMPSRTGKATNMKILAEAISKISMAPVADVLSGKNRKSLYEAKKKGETISADDLKMELSGKLPEGKIPVIVDNVLATGATFRAAKDAIPNAKIIVHSVDQLAVTQEAQKEVRSKARISEIEEYDLRLNYAVKLEKELEKLRAAYVEGRRIEKAEDLGMVTEQEFAQGMFKVLDAQRKYRAEKETLRAQLPRERGSNFIIEKLSRAARNNDISQFEADLAIDLIRKNPAVFEDLAISITKIDGQNPNVRGYYRASDSLIKLFKNNTGQLTAAHELLHHTEKFLPLEVRNGIINEWSKQIDSEVKNITKQLSKETNPTTKQKLALALAYLQLAKQAQTDTDTIAATAKQELMRKFLRDHLDTQGLFVPGLGQEYYKFFNPSEWWAVNASELFAKANTKPELKTWLDKAKAFYAALMESVRKILGTSATAAIQKGLDTVLQGKTLDVSQETMLANINSSFDVQPQGVTQEGQTEEEIILDAVENPLTTEDVEGREIEPGYEVFDQAIVIDSSKGRTNRKPFRSKASIKRDFEINDDDFVDVDEINGKTMVGFMGDVQVTGSVTTPTGLNLIGYGGPNYPAQANRNLKKDKAGYFVGRAAVWASTFEDSTGKLMKRMKDAQGALIGAQQNTGILGNRLMLKYFGEELKAAGERINSEETIVNFINEKIKTQFKKDKNTGVTSTFSEALGGVESFSSVDEFVDYLDPYLTSDQFVAKYPDSNNIVQKGDKKVTLLEVENKKKAERIVPYELRGALFVKMFNIDSHKKFGVPSIVPGKGYTYDKTVLEYANDTMFNEAGYGDFVGFVEFDPDTLKLEKVNQSSDFFNPSYEWVITAEKVRFKYFNEFLDGRALFYENTSASEKANQTPFGLRPKAAAARAIMGSQPTTTINAEKVKERQKGFASKSQLTEPSSDKWSPSLTQAEVDNIVGGDFASTLDEKVKEGKKHSTQIATTVGTYNKWVTWLEKNVPDFKNAQVLDVGAGLGHIHKAFGNKAGVVESYEPFYDKVQYQKYAGIQKPNYSEMDASDVPVGKYDVVVNNAVLNVVPSDIRESILNTIGDALKPGGIAIINAMDQGYLNSLIKKIDAGQSKNIKLSDTEVFVREGGKNSYQKGWTPQELQSYVQDVLGNEFSVERAPNEITSMTTVLVKKNQMGSKSQLTDVVAESKKLGVPQRYKGDVGKFIGGDLYVHKSAMDILPKAEMENAASKLPPNFNYEVIKYNEKSGAFSFIASPDWNTNPEPIVGDAYKVTPDGNVTITKQKADPQIYHHKWNFVRDDYNGFDVQESVQRSVDWFKSVKPNVNMFKIGTQSYWQNEALPNLRITQPTFKSKSQLDFTQIRPEYDAVMNQQFGTKEAAYRALIEKGYTPKRIKEAIGLYDFDETAFKKAQSQIAVNAINTVAQTYNVRQDEIKDSINQNLGDVESIYQDLIDEGYSNLEIFTAVTDMDFLSPQELIDIFGAEYRQTVKRAIDASTPYPTDFLDELESDARTLKVSQKAADIADVVREAGLGIVDSAVAIDSLLEFMKTNGFDQLAIALTEGVKKFGQDRTKFDKTLDWADQVRSGQVGDNLYTPEAINYAFSVSSELFSQAGRILQLARYFNETNQLAMIERQLAASGVVLTEMQKKTLESLLNDYKTAQADNKEKLKALQEDWSDQAYEAFNKSEEAVGIATIRVAQFLEARKPIFWNERLTSGAARALLNVSTAVLSFVANIENNIWSTNFVARAIQKLRDVIGSGIKGNTLSLSNWKMARKLTSKRMWFDMNNNAKFGVMDTSKGLNKYYDNLAQVNFFRDVKWNYNFMKAMVKKVLNRDFESMTPEEQADAYDLTLVKLKNGDIELRDGKTYTFARSLAWSLGTGPFLAARQSNASLLMNTGGPLFAEATGRIMSYGGDIAFGYMAAQRAMIDYFQNIQGTRFQDGIFGSMLENADGKLDEKTIRALSEILRADGELYARFEQEGLKRTLLGDNMISGVISLGRGQLRKKIRTLYTENRKQNSGSSLFSEFKREFLTGTGLYKNALQVLDVGFFTLMPFTKVPVNFLGSAIVKVVPYAAGAKYILSEGIYQYKYKQFNEKYNGIPALKTDKERRDYEKAKIDLFSAKRQATYDVAQFVTSIAIYGFAMSAVKAGAVLVGGSDEEKEKAFKLYGLKSGLYNATLHMEYLAAGMPSNFLARRGGFAKPGDVMLNTNNAGFLGYAMGLYGSVYEGKLKQEANNTMSLFDEQKSAMSMLLTNTLSSGVETLPMFQGLARIGEAMNSFKKEDATAGLKTFVSGSLSTSMAVFFPSFFSFMSKGNAELIQSTSDINKRAENFEWFMGDIGIRVIQKLNRNISFNENTRNDYYKAQIGPFGEDLSYKVTVAEPGTAGAYVQAFIDPFAIRTFASPSKQQQQEIQKYRESSQLFGEMVNLALTFKQITGQDFEWKVDGKTSSFFNIITNPMANKFPFAAGAENVGGLDEPNTYKLFEYSLPNDLYRKELMIRGEQYRSAMRKYIGLFATVRSQVQTAIEQGDEQRARRLITDMFEQYQSEVTETQKNYLSDYVRNREKKYLITLRDRKLITEEEKKIMIKSGFMTPEGLIP